MSMKIQKNPISEAEQNQAQYGGKRAFRVEYRGRPDKLESAEPKTMPFSKIQDRLKPIWPRSVLDPASNYNKKQE